MRARPRSWAGRSAIAVLVAVALAACGASGSSSSASSASTPHRSTDTAKTAAATAAVNGGGGAALPETESPVAGVETIASGLQLALQRLGYKPGQIDGIFSTATQAALRSYQAAKGIAASERGALGPATAGALAKNGAGGVVQALQSALTDVGLFQGTINGVYNSATVAAVRALQTKAKIGVDGFYGPDTARALTALYSRKDPEPTGKAPPKPPPKDQANLLKLGSKGTAVTKLQRRLSTLGYRPGAADGVFGAATASAVLAFQKRNGLTRDAVVGAAVEGALASPKGQGPRSGPVPRIDVDIARQIIFVVLKGGSVVTLNTSTGNGERYAVPGGGTDVAYTPVGKFTVIRKIPGDHKAPLGTLRNPLFFYRGWAIHGAANVPAYPASHGCARISNADADWLYPRIALGTPVIVYDTTGKSPGVNNAPAGAAPGY
jgi:peptidoglycan hydrolase-like protein with peptidoglycan-binding domain